MPDQDWEKLKDIFHAVVALPPNERAAYLDKTCDGNLSLRTAVQSLLNSHDATRNFVDTPAYQAAAEMLIDSAQLKTGSTVAHYRILSLLGEGGMGKVYLAEDTKLHRKVSLKFLSTNFAQDDERMRRFQQEARAISALNRPNILTIYEIGEANSLRFIATELIEGETLRERLRSEVAIDEAIEVALQVASALVAAHRVKIIHRDIKPENIMIRSDDGLVKVLDFGLAKMSVNQEIASGAIDQEAATRIHSHTAPGVVMGTAAYMSPEQARGDVIDERTDIWSLGIVLYEMVAGSSPFIASTSSEILAAILSKNPAPPLSRYSPVIPERLEEIVEKMLAKNRDERYQTSKDLFIDLKRLKQSLETKAAIERSESDKLRVASGDTPTKVRSGAESATGHPTSSAEYIVGQVKSHKRGVIIGLASVLAAATVALIYIYTGRLQQTPASNQLEIKSLAVLPLKSFDTGDNYLGLGIADAVILRISQTGKVIVRPTSAVRRYLSEDTDGLTAAKQLGVDSVLEGTVQRAKDRLRVNVNLLRTSDGTSLWTHSFDLRADDIFTIQDTISHQVASRRQLKLDAEQQARLGKRYTSNPEAYEQYVKGLTYLERITTAIGDRDAIDAAIAHFKKAVEMDPKYALAYAALGDAYMWKANFTDPDNNVWVGLAQKALAEAETLDPFLAEIHAARFEYYVSKYGNWDLAQAAREARHALALNPSVGPYRSRYVF
jgi:eukaryotic-like serine/threonine-protein kinase